MASKNYTTVEQAPKSTSTEAEEDYVLTTLYKRSQDINNEQRYIYNRLTTLVEYVSRNTYGECDTKDSVNVKLTSADTIIYNKLNNIGNVLQGSLTQLYEISSLISILEHHLS
jgi:hypothetical protein